MVLKARERLEAESNHGDGDLAYFVSTARLLPFPDGYFDAVFHFGGFNNFSEPAKTLGEITRVARIGGRVVFGDEAIPPWLREHEFGRMLIENNPLFACIVPLEHLPANARDVVVRWVLGSCFYLIDYTVGDGPPPVDIDLPHKGSARRDDSHPLLRTARGESRRRRASWRFRRRRPAASASTSGWKTSSA